MRPAHVTPARFPHVPPSAAHYESFFLKACHPDGGLAVWIRYTVHQRPGQPPKGFVWFTLFDADQGVSASKAEYPTPAADATAYIEMQDCRFSPGEVVGRAHTPQLDASWELRFEGDEPPVWHLPRWAYRAALPRTKLLSPHPHVLVRGQVRAGERTIDMQAWPGTVGHNWGSEHARRSIWIHGANFAAHDDAWFDLAIGRIGLGPVTTRWIANGELSLDGRRYRLGGAQRVATTRIEEEVETCRFKVPGEGIDVTGTIGAPRRNFAGWIYAQPKGGERQTINCSIADLHLNVSQADRSPVSLTLTGGAAYELQMAERYPPIPIQPFPDG